MFDGESCSIMIVNEWFGLRMAQKMWCDCDCCLLPLDVVGGYWPLSRKDQVNPHVSMNMLNLCWSHATQSTKQSTVDVNFVRQVQARRESDEDTTNIRAPSGCWFSLTEEQDLSKADRRSCFVCGAIAAELDVCDFSCPRDRDERVLATFGEFVRGVMMVNDGHRCFSIGWFLLNQSLINLFVGFFGRFLLTMFNHDQPLQFLLA